VSAFCKRLFESVIRSEAAIAGILACDAARCDLPLREGRLNGMRITMVKFSTDLKATLPPEKKRLSM
jgi:hypothetical protein